MITGTVEILPTILTEATISVFDTMIGLPVKAGIPRWHQVPPSFNASKAIVGLIGLAGKWTGNLSIHLNWKLARRITLGLLGLEERVGPEEVRDAIGEVTNMIAGQVKNQLGRGSEVAISLPSVITGRDFTLQRLPELPSLLLPFSQEETPFYIFLALKEDHGT